MHVSIILDGQLDEHLLFWQPAISVTLYFALYSVLLFEMQIKYGDDNVQLSYLEVRLDNAI